MPPKSWMCKLRPNWATFFPRSRAQNCFVAIISPNARLTGKARGTQPPPQLAPAEKRAIIQADVTYPTITHATARASCPTRSWLSAPTRLEEVATWVFDDPAAGLAQEPFVSGVPEMIDLLVKDIPDARRGFRLLFSAAPFPGYQKRFTRRREEMGGYWYSSAEPPLEGWLCPALFRYFDQAPAELYVKAEAKDR